MQFLVKAGSSICANHTPESYPKNHDYECFFWDRFKLIDQCWPDPMIPGYLHGVANFLHVHRVSSLSLSWLAGWVAGSVAAAGWVAGYRAG